MNPSQKSLTKTETKKYVLSTAKDYEILAKVKQLEKLNLNKDNKLLIKLIKSQLEQDWRKSLMRELDKLLHKYKL
ncbi:MAG: hypothetical protein ACD_41C00152G0007 [uncultured bacterium]|nr:MAG: hypothetical protein ACD_41C00152G0007 [uncultured bacterium]